MIYSKAFALDALKAIVCCFSIVLISSLAFLAIRHDGDSYFLAEMLNLSRLALGQAGALIAIGCFNFTYYSWAKDGRLGATLVSGKSIGGLMWPALTICLIIALLTNALLPSFSMPSAAHLVGDSKWTMVLSDNDVDYSLIEVDRRQPGLSKISTIPNDSLVDNFPFLRSSFPLNSSLIFTVIFFMLCTIFNVSCQRESLSPNSLRLFLLPAVFVFFNTFANRTFSIHSQVPISGVMLILIVCYALVMRYTKIPNMPQ